MSTQSNEVKKHERLESLDVLRGFDMLWIAGGGGLIIALAQVTKWGWLEMLAGQMEHVVWDGFHFEDLIFPLFMFISGVAIPYAITSKVEQGAVKKLLFHKIIKRGLTLVLLGIICNGVFRSDPSVGRFSSVLGQIGLGYLFAATIVLYSKSIKTRIFWLVGILCAIAILQLLVPVPGFGAGLLDPVNGINAWLDRMLLPGLLYGKTFDPEGPLCVVSAITVTLIGSLAGSILRDGEPASQRKATKLAIAGVALTSVALILSTFYPIIKAAWTVPFNLLTTGLGFMLLSLFYFVIDVKKWTKGAASYFVLFFKVIGMNSITIYVAMDIINFGQISQLFTGWLVPSVGDWIMVLGAIVIEWLFLYFLYQKKIFLRV